MPKLEKLAKKSGKRGLFGLPGMGIGPDGGVKATDFIVNVTGKYIWNNLSFPNYLNPKRNR